MNKVLRCPNCNEIIGNNLSRFCSSCGNALDAHQYHSVVNKEMERLFDNIHEEISDLKKVKPKMVTNALIEHLYVTIPLLSILIALIIYKFNSGQAAGVFGCFAFFANMFLFIDFNDSKDKNLKLRASFKKKHQDTTYRSVKADVEKSIQKAKIKYGASKELSRLIEEFNSEALLIERKNKRVKVSELIIYGLVVLGLIGVFLIPTEPRINEEEQAIQINTELELIEDEINRAIQNEDYDNALDLTNQLHHPLHVIYNGKGGVFNTVYYDEYWDSKREKYKSQILEKQTENLPKMKSQSRTITKKEVESSDVIEEFDDYAFPDDSSSLDEDAVTRALEVDSVTLAII